MNKNDAEAPLVDHAPDGVALTDGERKAALKKGAQKDAEKTGEAAHHALTDGIQLGNVEPDRWHGSSENQQYADIVELGLAEFEKVIDGKTERNIPDEKVAGLLALERNGQNRTPYVRALMKRLGIKADELSKIPGAGGPDYTNDLTSLSDL